MAIVKKLLKASDPSFFDKVKLAKKRISRNLTNRKAVNQLQKSQKYQQKGNIEKSNTLYDKSEATYNKAVDKNIDIAKFRRKKGFDMKEGDGTYFGTSNYKKSGKIWSKAEAGGTFRAVKKMAKGGTFKARKKVKVTLKNKKVKK